MVKTWSHACTPVVRRNFKWPRLKNAISHHLTKRSFKRRLQATFTSKDFGDKSILKNVKQLTRHFQKDLLSNTDANFYFFSNKAKQLIFKTYVFPQQFQVQVQAHFLKKERFGFNQKSIQRLRMNLEFIQCPR